MPTSTGSPLGWGVFLAVVLCMLALDLGLFRRGDHVVRKRDALLWTGIWIGLALLFALGIYFERGSKSALEFVTGYLIEEALSVDNLFVFLVIFSYFRVPAAYQHRILIWGIVGALLMRAVFIGAGSALVARFGWILYIFGGILVVTGIKLLFEGDEEADPERNLIIRMMRRLIRATPDYHGSRFLVRVDGKWHATPPLLVLVIIEATDLVFALDSIPAIFGITTDAFIIYTSNIFAILGLRNLFFLLAAVMDKFRFLKFGLGLVLTFIGLKMVAGRFAHISVVWSLAVVATLLGGSILLSVLIPPRRPPP
ncbi:MAG: TerC family protein [Planctomycetota bacterium]